MKKVLVPVLVLCVGAGALMTWLDVGIPISVTVVVEKREEVQPDSSDAVGEAVVDSPTTTVRRKKKKTEPPQPEEDRSSSTVVDEPRRIVFVHVGKCGGETLNSNLRSACFTNRDPVAREACDNRKQHPDEPALSKQLIGYMHNAAILPTPDVISHATTFLILSRNPIHRVVSWFSFHNPTNCDPEKGKHTSPGCSVEEHPFTKELFECFPVSMEAFAQSLSPDSSGDCSTLAKRAMKLEGSSLGQLGKNYKFYVDRIGGLSKEILTVRTEHLWDDVRNVNQIVSTVDDAYSEDAFVAPKEFHHGLLDKVNRTLSEEGKRNLCCYLLEEIQIYIQILDAAINLDKADADASKNAVVVDTCGAPNMESLEQACRRHI